jgi:hypothetical protein
VHEQTVTGHNVRYVLGGGGIGVEDGDSGRDIVRPLATLSQGPNARRRRALSERSVRMAFACPASLRILENVQSMAPTEPEGC